jgi:hypothetical protein
MNKYMDKVKSRTVKVMLIGCCISALWTGAAYAETGASTNEPSVVSQETGISDVLLKKQQEIDKYVFEQHADELAKKGIIVTNTGPVGGVVEIGITSYNEANADYLYGIFGKEIVKVVAGTQAVTLGSGSDEAANVSTSADVIKVADVAKAAETSQAAEAGLPSFIMVIYILAAALIVGGATFLVRRQRMVKQ